MAEERPPGAGPSSPSGLANRIAAWAGACALGLGVVCANMGLTVWMLSSSGSADAVQAHSAAKLLFIASVPLVLVGIGLGAVSLRRTQVSFAAPATWTLGISAALLACAAAAVGALAMLATEANHVLWWLSLTSAGGAGLFGAAVFARLRSMRVAVLLTRAGALSLLLYAPVGTVVGGLVLWFSGRHDRVEFVLE